MYVVKESGKIINDIPTFLIIFKNNPNLKKK